MFKKFFVTMLFAVIILSVLALNSDAYQGKADKQGKKNFTEIFFNKVHIVFENKAMLNLTKEQKEKIVDLKIETKKKVIRSSAEIEIIGLDIEKELKQEKINLKAVNKLVDKKYELKKENMKSLIEAYATLKDILTKEQKDLLSDMKKGGLGRYHQRGFMGKGGKSSCPYSELKGGAKDK